LRYQITSYLKHRLRSTNQHGIHSPFVYDLITKCFYDKTIYPEYSVLKKYRNELLRSKETINVTDFGAGSRVFRSNTRKVSAMAKNAGISKKRQQRLYRLVHYFKPGRILELGTSLGLGTSALALGNPSAYVVTVEGCPAISAKAQELFKEFELNNIRLQNITFDDFLSSLSKAISDEGEANDSPDTISDEGTDTPENYDLIYLDGDHSKERTLQYFDILMKKIHKDSIFILDDIHWSRSMTEAWEQIIKHPDVTVSIDTYQWGILFFRKEQEQQHFRIRM
jgi:predicted O-methyltransferase YrrM